MAKRIAMTDEERAERRKHEQQLTEQAVAQLRQFVSFRISWVPREMNAEADRLVNDALGAP